MKTQRISYPVMLKPEFADLYKGKLELDRLYQAVFHATNPNILEIRGTDITHAPKNHFRVVEGQD